MPYVEGETIREKLNRETQFGVDEAVRIAREVADALDYAHRHGVIHRDIKPENILLHDGRAIVMDFGIALAVSAAAGSRMTDTGLSLGTPHYMSRNSRRRTRPSPDARTLLAVAAVRRDAHREPPAHGNLVAADKMQIIAEYPPAATERASRCAYRGRGSAKALGSAGLTFRDRRGRPYCVGQSPVLPLRALGDRCAPEPSRRC